jgi:4,5-dihydroxyphthalate decarboxylase
MLGLEGLSLKLSLACPEYDKTEAILNGEVKPEGIELSASKFLPADAHRGMLKDAEYDVSEMSISYYLISKSQGKAIFTAIPVFPMRSFFHVQLVCNSESGINSPFEIKGKRIGVQEYGMSLALWLRAVMQHEFGILPSDLEWFLERQPGQTVGDAIGFTPPSNVTVRHIQPDSSITNMLDKGEIDLAFPYPSFWRTRLDRPARSQDESSRRIHLLFPNPKEESIRYFRKTGLFPINHVIVIKNKVLERAPWIASSLLEAFERSKQISYERSAQISEMPNNFVWLDSLYKEVHQIFGIDPFPYGVKKNEKILEAVTTYSHEQRLAKRKLDITELFAPTTLGS